MSEHQPYLIKANQVAEMSIKEYHQHLVNTANQVLAESKIDVSQPINQLVVLRLAKEMKKRTGAHIVTCKRHIWRAIRRARWGEPERKWGGPRPGSGRPHKD